MSDTRGRSLVIGIGNQNRGDDGAGRATARWLEGKLPPDVEILELDGESASLLEHLEGVTAAYLVDACTSGAAVGTVRRFDVSAAPLPHEAFSVSTHGLGLSEAVELARALGQLPDRCVIYAIEGVSFELGAPMSPPVIAATAEVGKRLQGEICAADVAEGGIDA